MEVLETLKSNIKDTQESLTILRKNLYKDHRCNIPINTNLSEWSTLLQKNANISQILFNNFTVYNINANTGMVSLLNNSILNISFESVEDNSYSYISGDDPIYRVTINTSSSYIGGDILIKLDYNIPTISSSDTTINLSLNLQTVNYVYFKTDYSYSNYSADVCIYCADDVDDEIPIDATDNGNIQLIQDKSLFIRVSGDNAHHALDGTITIDLYKLLSISSEQHMIFIPSI